MMQRGGGNAYGEEQTGSGDIGSDLTQFQLKEAVDKVKEKLILPGMNEYH
jgi:transcription-repair coupling factor (superfamily II helicase)